MSKKKEARSLTEQEQTTKKALYGSAKVLFVVFATLFATSVLFHFTFDQSLVEARYYINEYVYDEAVYLESTARTIQGILLIADIIFALVAFVFFCLSCISVGQRDESGTIHMNWFDRAFMEVKLVLAALGFVPLYFSALIGVTGFVNHGAFPSLMARTVSFDDHIIIDHIMDEIVTYVGWGELYFVPASILILGAIILIAFVATIWLEVSCSIAKHIKNHSLLQNTLLGQLFVYLAGAAEKNRNTFAKVMILMVVATLLSATGYGAVVVLILILLFVPTQLKKFGNIEEGLHRILSGDFDYKIPVNGSGDLDRIAMDINSISDAQRHSIDNELREQRTKTELLTNVSHDLRTPLTSMVSYIDLLKSEGLDSPNASDYLKILEEKTDSLKRLTDNLFEAAKASSGDIPVNLEPVEMIAMTNQALAELSGSLEENNLTTILNSKLNSPVMVMADGQLLWRVLENLLTNVGKYSVPGTRVYLDIYSPFPGQIALDVKNVSNHQLNISADELMERFKRGDQSRNTDGSGLGLSIAKDLTTLMGGTFGIHIDGDLFKATVVLNKVPEEQPRFESPYASGPNVTPMQGEYTG